MLRLLKVSLVTKPLRVTAPLSCTLAHNRADAWAGGSPAQSPEDPPSPGLAADAVPAARESVEWAADFGDPAPHPAKSTAALNITAAQAGTYSSLMGMANLSSYSKMVSWGFPGALGPSGHPGIVMSWARLRRRGVSRR